MIQTADHRPGKPPALRSRRTTVALGARLPWPMTRGRGRAFMLAYAALLFGGAILSGLLTVALAPEASFLRLVAPVAWFFLVRAIAHRVIMRCEPGDVAQRSEQIREDRLARIYS